MANSRNIIKANIVMLMAYSDKEKGYESEFENHRSDGTASESSDNGYDIDMQPMHNIQSI